MKWGWRSTRNIERSRTQRSYNQCLLVVPLGLLSFHFSATVFPHLGWCDKAIGCGSMLSLHEPWVTCV